jgi:hypothetical protein
MMADNYNKLTEAEKAHWDEYTRLRELSDWAGYSDEQDERRAIARDWLVEQRKYIWRCAEGKIDGVQAGWDINYRSARYAQLGTDSLNVGACRRVASLPRGNATDAEKALLAERCMWWMVTSTNDEQKARKQDCTDWLIARRQQVYGLIQDSSTEENKANHRSERYNNLSIATKHGSAYADWCETHDPKTGAAYGTGGSTAPAGSSRRQQAVENARAYVGVAENPPDSNRGKPQPDDWQNRVMGFSGQPWCACFVTCMAWDVGVIGSSSAGVQVIVNMARQGQGMFRGYTTDPSKVLRGDFAIIGCESCHVGLVAETDDPCHTIEGNTSPSSSGSQYNGGCVAEKRRPRSDIVGWALVDYPS